MENMEKKKTIFKTIKISLIVLCSLVGVFILTISTYLIYVIATYYRIDDNQILEIENNQKSIVPIDEELTFTCYNIGFGAYSSQFTFFLDEGINADGSSSWGYYSKGLSYDDVFKNTTGSIEAIKNLDSDFYAIQEVDVDSDRAYHINQQKMIQKQMTNYAETFAINFHSAYLAYPLYDNHGKSLAGLQTLSKYHIENSIRKSFVVSNAFPDKFFDLDRCFSVNVIPVENEKKMILINSHMSAYDEGGIIRNQQLKQLNEYLLNEYQNGNYIIVGGDFNHDLLTYNPKYNYTKSNLPFSDTYTQLQPNWLSFMFEEDGTCNFDSRFAIYVDDSTPSLRGADCIYEPGKTFVCTVDGFIVSDNVEVIGVKTHQTTDTTTDMFAFSDHQPTTLTFKLS